MELSGERRELSADAAVSSAASAVVVALVPSHATLRARWLDSLEAVTSCAGSGYDSFLVILPAGQVGHGGFSRQRCITHAVVDLHVRACAPSTK